MTNKAQYLLALVVGVLIVATGFATLFLGGPTYSAYGWLLIAVGALSVLANVAMSRLRT